MWETGGYLMLGPGLEQMYVLSQEPGSKIDGTQSLLRNASLSVPGREPRTLELSIRMHTSPFFC